MEMLNRKKLTDLICKMKSNGVVIYGAGQRGRIAYEILTDSGISINAIADRMSTVIGNMQSISLNELCEISNDEVCIVTPDCDMTQEIECLKRFYSEVVDYGIVNFLNYYIPINHGDNNLVNYHPFNHYESPYPDNVGYNYLENNNIEELSGINLSYEDHLDYFNMLKPFMKEFIESITDEDRYSASNDMFPLSDAARYSGIIRLYMPKKIIEIGSGFSTFAAMDTIDKWLVEKTSITCIEPYPERLFSRMTEIDKNTTYVIRDFVQNVDLSMFEKLEQGDILFIDSSHVTKSGGDIPFEYFNILPRLKPGVIIHIHDIFYPFDYPLQWFGRGYNEAFVLRALLTDSTKYKMLFFSDYMNKIHPEIYENDSRYAGGGSIWIQKN